MSSQGIVGDESRLFAQLQVALKAEVYLLAFLDIRDDVVAKLVNLV